MGRRHGGFSRLEIICAVVSAVAAVVGLVLAYQQLIRKDPPPDLSGKITGAFVDTASGNVVRGQFELAGFKGEGCPVKATVLDAATGQPVGGLSDQPVITLRPEADRDRAAFPLTVKLPAAPGRYMVTLVLFDPDGVELDRFTTQPVQIGPAPPAVTTTTDPNAYPNALERALLTHVPSASNSRCRRANPLNLGDTAGIQCEPSVGASAVWYYQFPDLSRLGNAYNASVTRTGVSGGGCNATTWHGESTYNSGTAVAGRRLCYRGFDGRQWVEWTNERLLILARANSPDFNVLLEWWMHSAGPV